MASKGQRFKYREEELIYKVVQENISGKPYSYLEGKYKITRGTMMIWVKRYKERGYVNRNKRGLKKSVDKMTIEELRLEVDILKKFQAFLNHQQERK